VKTMFVSLCDRSIERGMERMYNAQAGRRRVQLTAKSRGGGTRREGGWMDDCTRGRSSKYRRLADIPFEFVS
jgi:hypothetical protein